jgi:excisionase family DNA binding protein
MRKKPDPEPTLPSEIWDAEQACKFLKCGRTKLYELLDAGLPSRKIGGRRFFDPRDVAGWWHQQRESA